MMTGFGPPGGLLALAAALVVAAPVRNAESGRRVAELPAEVAGEAGHPRPGVERVLDELLDHRRRALDHVRSVTAACGAFAMTSGGVAHVPDARAGVFAAPDRAGPEYYQFPMVSTRRVPGTGNASGVGEVAFARSPYGVALGSDGSYEYDFTVRFERLALARDGAYVVWTTTPELDQVALAGELTDPAGFGGKVGWNKFLVVVTLEPSFDPGATKWTGPIVIRGMSRSGMMHTMAGHGPFEEKNCAAYGY